MYHHYPLTEDDLLPSLPSSYPPPPPSAQRICPMTASLLSESPDWPSCHLNHPFLLHVRDKSLASLALASWSGLCFLNPTALKCSGNSLSDLPRQLCYPASWPLPVSLGTTCATQYHVHLLSSKNKPSANGPPLRVPSKGYPPTGTSWEPCCSAQPHSIPSREAASKILSGKKHRWGENIFNTVQIPLAFYPVLTLTLMI